MILNLFIRTIIIFISKLYFDIFSTIKIKLTGKNLHTDIQAIFYAVLDLNVFLYRIKIGYMRNPLQGTVLVCYVPVPESLLGVLALRVNLDSRLPPRKTVLTSIVTIRIVQ